MEARELKAAQVAGHSSYLSSLENSYRVPGSARSERFPKRPMNDERCDARRPALRDSENPANRRGSISLHC